ncbi:MAG: serine hydrolase [Kiritimatiellae bacterium]|nr:serine hydrolase [Kiritimatiellia bacterium]
MRRWYFTILTLVLATTIAISACNTEGLDSSRFGLLKARIIDGTFKDINSIIVVKHGKILIEEYFNGADSRALHDMRSAGKSFTSALVGIAIDKGLINGVDERLLSYFPGVECNNDWDTRKNDITLKHVLSMSFGLAEPGEFPAWEDANWYTINWIGDVLCQPIEYEPGSRFDYDSAAPALFGPIIERVSGMSVGRFADNFLFGPLGIEGYRWFILPGGQEYTGGNFRMRPRDMARFGQLYLQKGIWNGKQLISKEWVKESTRAHLIANAQLDQHYGYYWWRETFPIDTRWIESYFASGNGGNKIYVFPTEDLVVVITASAYDQSYSHPQVRMMMNKYILPAVIQDKDSHSGNTDLKIVPRTGFAISVLVFLVILVLCILWPSAFPSKPLCTDQSKSSDNGGNRRWLRLVRIWIGANTLVGILFVVIVLGEAATLDLWLNSGYVCPFYPALHKVIASWVITILTVGSVVISVSSWWNRYLSNIAGCCFSILALVSIYCVLSLWYLGLLFFVS